ncbi:12450_t:CDS:2 [Funneliformis geosporum]|nr:12450_t:CDS:2 [Funneliformis geosporum]
MEGIIITSTQSSNIYNMQPARNRALNILALNILKYLSEDNLREEPDFLSIKFNNTIPDYGPYGKCDNPILTEDPPRSLVLNACGDIDSCGMADVMEEGANNSQDEVVTSTTLNESYKWSSIENTSSRKKMKVKKGSKVTLHELPMLKKLIEELSTSPDSDEDNSES